MIGTHPASKMSRLVRQIVTLAALRYGPLRDEQVDESYQIAGMIYCLLWLLIMLAGVVGILRLQGASDVTRGWLIVGMIAVSSITCLESLRIIRSRYP